MREPWRELGGLLLACTLSVSAAARTGDPFEQVDAVDELALARLAQSQGDASLLAHLAGSRFVAAVAARASVHAHAPEQLIPTLARLACGRDPALAPEAAFSLRKLAERLRPSELSAREVLREDLQKALSSLQCAQTSPPPRADIVLSLAQLVAVLQPLVL